MAKMNKRMQAATANLDRNINYSVADAARLIKDGATSKFDETIEVAINLGVDPRHADQMVRGSVAMPKRYWQRCSCGGICKRRQGG